MATFPTALGCAITSGFTEKFPRVARYQNSKQHVYKSHGTVTVFIKGDQNMSEFTDWYFNDISVGTGEFTIELPFFGITRLWNVVLTTRISTAPDSKNVKNRRIPMQLKILDDVSAYV